MKKIVLLSVTALMIYSCQITERFYLQESGAVKYETEINFSDMLSFMYDQNTKDSLRQIGEYPLDTLMNFADFEKFNQLGTEDVSPAQLEFLKAMDKTKIHMVINDNEGKMIVRVEEKNINELNAYLKRINLARAKLEKEDPAAAAEMNQTGMMNPLELKFDGKKFQRIADNQTDFLNELDDSTAEATRQMMNMFNYKLEYHFPKRVKNSSLKDATYSQDGKIMIVEASMTDLLENPDKYNFTVELE